MAEAPPPKTRHGSARWLFLVSGLLCTVLATIGAFLPLLPTTPFLLLAAASFARSSPTFHRRLLASRVFGPYLTQWQHDRTIPRAAKRKAYGLVVVTFAVSIALLDATWLRVALALLGVGLITFLARLPTAPEPRGARRAPSGGHGRSPEA